MFDLSDFYSYCRENDIDIIPYRNAPSEGTTIRDGEEYAIFLDFTKIKSIACTKRRMLSRNRPCGHRCLAQSV